MTNQQQTFSQKMLDWHCEYGRKNLPWQGQNPYYVWISEIMLQQTQVSKVKDYFKNFIHKFPTLTQLAKADVADVLASWSGLGYYNRARNLHKTAQTCLRKYEGNLPSDLKSLMDLPGIGKTTAGAILSLSMNKPYAILDGNVKRVLSRVFAVRNEKISALDKKLWNLSEQLVSQDNPKDYNQSLMDLGSMICKRAQPKCYDCPLIDDCLAYKRNEIALYPQAKKQTKKIKKTIYALMVLDQEKVFLQQRENHGIWPQLWFLPTFDQLDELNQSCKNLPLTAVAEFSVEHILTHRIFDIQVTYASGKSTGFITGQWFEIADLDSTPHPSALQKILQRFEPHAL